MAFSDGYEPEFQFEDDDDDREDAVKAEISTVLHSYVNDMTPAERVQLKEAVREKLEELDAEEELQNELEEGIYLKSRKRKK